MLQYNTIPCSLSAAVPRVRVDYGQHRDPLAVELRGSYHQHRVVGADDGDDRSPFLLIEERWAKMEAFRRSQGP